MNNLQVFNFKNSQVRTVIKSGEPWFVAKDVCGILDIRNHNDALHRLSESMKGVATADTLGGNQEVSIVSEAGVYKLVFTSRKPEAETFTDWIATEVIPSIRKHGAYMTPQAIEQVLLNPDTIIQLATNLKAEQERSRQLAGQIEADKPKVLFADSVAASQTSILIGELAKILKQNGVDIGQNRLFDWLRKNGYLISRMGTDYNMPTQRSMERGLFTIKETAVTHSDGHVSVNKTPKVTGKGQQYFINKFLSKPA